MEITEEVEEEKRDEEEGDDEEEEDEGEKVEKNSETEDELEKEEIIEISDEIIKYCKIINIEKLKLFIPKIKSRLEKLGVNQKNNALEIAYKSLPKDGDDEEKTKNNMRYIIETVERFRDNL